MHILSEEFEDKLLRVIDNRFEDFLKAISKQDNKQLELISSQEVMNELGVGYNTLKRWEEAGLKRYQAPVEGTRKVYYLRSHIYAFLGVENNGKP